MAADQRGADHEHRIFGSTCASWDQMKRVDETRPELVLDARNRVASVNGAWAEAMPDGGFHQQCLDACIGRPFWDFAPGVQVRQLWEILFDRVRAVGAPIFVPTRADTPSLRRVWDIELHPMPERGLLLVAHFVWTEQRPILKLLHPDTPRSGATLPYCAWCNRVQVRIGAWEEVEDAHRTLSFDVADQVPELRPTACDGCKQALLKTFPARVA